MHMSRATQPPSPHTPTRMHACTHTHTHLRVLWLWQVAAAGREVQARAPKVLVVHVARQLVQLLHLQQQVHGLGLCARWRRGVLRAGVRMCGVRAGRAGQTRRA
jgi:hypothetical protein